MKDEYDFSKAERGKFYHSPIELDIPVYLDTDVAAFVAKLAEAKGSDVSTIVNDWMRRNIALIETTQ
ncbi:MAG: hypothetical protein AAFX01_07385 [Cyanobacteria bacterium J06638_28]